MNTTQQVRELFANNRHHLFTLWEVVGAIMGSNPTKAERRKISQVLDALARDGSISRAGKTVERNPYTGLTRLTTRYRHVPDDDPGEAEPPSQLLQTLRYVLWYDRNRAPHHPKGVTVQQVYNNVMPHLRKDSGTTSARQLLNSLVRSGHATREQRTTRDSNGRYRVMWAYMPASPLPKRKPRFTNTGPLDPEEEP